jgi:hypothetical protein
MEVRHSIAGLEIAVRCDDAALLADLVATWRGYDGGVRPPEVVIEYAVDPEFRGDGSGVESPAFAARAVSEREHEFRREDAAGRLELDDVVVARFTGRPARGILEAAVRIALAAALPRRGGLLVHGAGTIVDGRGVVCPGPSGAGKSTLDRLLRGRFASLGDELVAVRGKYAHATPFAGENGAVARARAPLAALCFLEQAPRHGLARLDRPHALRRLLRNVMAHVLDRAGADHVLGVAAEIVATVPAHVLGFARDSGVAEVLAEL